VLDIGRDELVANPGVATAGPAAVRVARLITDIVASLAF
jgi:hypothetical protein